MSGAVRGPWALRTARALSLETRGLTAAYWLATAAYVVALTAAPLPPLIDYPQHLGIAGILHRWLAGGDVERSLYEVNLFTYNASFHTAVALLTFILPIEWAGKLVVALVPVGFAMGVLSLMRALRRPPSYALAIVPVTFHSALAWGFVNNSLGFGAALWAIGIGVRAQRGERGAHVRLGLATLLVAYMHICAAFVLTASVGLLACQRAVLGPGAARARGKTFLRCCLALLPGVLLSAAFVAYNAGSAHSNWENAAHDGVDEYAWRKVAWFASLVVGQFVDHSDRTLFAGLLAVVVYLHWPRRRHPRWRRPPSDRSSSVAIRRDSLPRAPGAALVFVFFALLYLVTPRVVFATWFMFERFGPLVMVWAVGAAPMGRFAREGVFRASLALLALATAFNVARHTVNYPDVHDATAVLRRVPPGARVLGLIWDPSPWPVLERQVYAHVAAYHVARQRGEVMPSFAFIESMPVHYRADKRPPRTPVSFEWFPQNYDLDAAWARYFDTVLVRSAWNVADPTPQVFGERASEVRLVAHEGRFWLYDASPLFADTR